MRWLNAKADESPLGLYLAEQRLTGHQFHQYTTSTPPAFVGAQHAAPLPSEGQVLAHAFCAGMTAWNLGEISMRGGGCAIMLIDLGAGLWLEKHSPA